MKHIVIIGGGFGGIRTARKLRKNKNVKVTVVNEKEDFRYCPALYRAATGYKMGTARLPIEWMLLDSNNADIEINKATQIDPDTNTITLADESSLSYDYAVLALGSVTTYFSIDGLHDHSFGIKTVEEIIELREHVHEVLTDRNEAEQNYVVIGAGPTGVELAAALGSYLQNISKKHNTSADNITIWLVEGQDRVLPQLNPKASKLAHKRLEKLGVRIELDTMVKSETLHTLDTSHGRIKTHTVVWTAGTTNNPFYKENEDHFKINDNRKIEVNDHLQTHDDVYVIGDNANTKHSGTALTAIRHGTFVAKDINARIKGTHRPSDYEQSSIHIVPVGPGWAIMNYKNLAIGGIGVYWLRRIADYMGYSDVLGYYRALTIWSNSSRHETDCIVCAS
jgi:NADH dehydrogenase